MAKFAASGVGRTVSYSIYVWQQIFIIHVEGAFLLGWINHFPVNLICVFIAASGSYYFLEKPAILSRFLRVCVSTALIRGQV
jgi:peptidoglycan/LPS O-acetylase OafA/YrhL